MRKFSITYPKPCSLYIRGTLDPQAHALEPLKDFVESSSCPLPISSRTFFALGMPVALKLGLGSVRPPLSNSWIVTLIWLYIALNRTPNIDCDWVGAVPKVQGLGFRDFRAQRRCCSYTLRSRVIKDRFRRGMFGEVDFIRCAQGIYRGKHKGSLQSPPQFNPPK